MIPEAFKTSVRAALGHLHNHSALEGSALATHLANEGTPLSGPALRQILLDALERLKPARSTPSTLAESRRYRHLVLRYVEGWNRDQIARELMVSPRQASRDHEQAIDQLAEMLWGRRAACRPSTGGSTTGMTAANGVDGQADLLGVLRGSLATLEDIFRERNVRLTVSLPDLLAPVAISPDFLRQCLLHLFSYAAEIGSGGVLVISAADVAEGVVTRIEIAGQTEPTTQRKVGGTEADELFEFGARLLEGQGGAVRRDRENDGPRVLTIILPPARQSRVLVVDDNPDIVDLFRRYLRGEPYRLIQAMTGVSALRLARELQPNLIILDVMLPSHDGWDVLRELRSCQELKTTPVVVCSVLPEIALAREFGVTDFLIKPVTRQSLLAVLERWCPAQAAHPAPP